MRSREAEQGQTMDSRASTCKDPALCPLELRPGYQRSL